MHESICIKNRARIATGQNELGYPVGILYQIFDRRLAGANKTHKDNGAQF